MSSPQITPFQTLQISGASTSTSILIKEESQSTEFIDLVNNNGWPIVAVIIALIFKDHIGKVFISLSRKIDGMSTYEKDGHLFTFNKVESTTTSMGSSGVASSSAISFEANG